ncbi:IS481 family transposase (plasmid) [Rhodococcus pyridinivorans]|uniref:IS481 family transposase n=1 Tax=Rhodococcus pyridinivorans TaxID=103816 RepID=UPI0020C60BA7|nr:IS481 family transposase [Rhodococcus pyridinivorans]UTM39957.1 IS481 family transposase [Rhodococcus pyridinivorans]
MAHANARLNAHGRRLLVERVLGHGRPVAHVAKELGISRQCAHRWINRFKQAGEAGLVDRSSAPKRCPRRTSPEVEQRVLELRRTERRGQDWLGPELGIPARTVGAILARHQVPKLCVCDPLTGEVIRSSKVTTVRYERPDPGDLVHVDVKKVGRIPPGGGWKAHGRSEEVRGRGIGYDYLHAAVDDHSRFAYVEVLDDEKGSTCAGFMLRAAEAFAAHGITIEEVITDNAKNYKPSREFAAAMAAISARHLTIKPHCPWQNGKVERFNRTVQTEWAYRQVFTSNEERTAALAPWLDYYNTRRRHSAIGGLPPISRLS